MLETKIIPLLIEQDLINSEGVMTFSLLNTEIEVTTKDVIGGVLQDWFGHWMTKNNIFWQTGLHAQTWPDFILLNNEHLEFKAFDGEANPNFDLANFDAYTRSLLDNPERLDTNHLIFEYRLNLDSGIIKVTDFWSKKIWQMTGPSDKNILNLQVKQGVPINIRPKNWRTNSNRVKFFNSRLEFVVALSKALDKFHVGKYKNWLDQIKNKYETVTGNVL